MPHRCRRCGYIRYPDAERTELGKEKSRLIQTKPGSTGWIYDGEQKKLRDQTPEEIVSAARLGNVVKLR